MLDPRSSLAPRDGRHATTWERSSRLSAACALRGARRAGRCHRPAIQPTQRAARYEEGAPDSRGRPPPPQGLLDTAQDRQGGRADLPGPRSFAGTLQRGRDPGARSISSRHSRAPSLQGPIDAAGRLSGLQASGLALPPAPPDREIHAPPVLTDRISHSFPAFWGISSARCSPCSPRQRGLCRAFGTSHPAVLSVIAQSLLSTRK